MNTTTRPDQSLPLAILTALVGGFRIVRRRPPSMAVKRNRLAPPGLFDARGPQPKRRNPTRFAVNYRGIVDEVEAGSVHQAAERFASKWLLPPPPEVMQMIRHRMRPIAWADEPVAKAA